MVEYGNGVSQGTGIAGGGGGGGRSADLGVELGRWVDSTVHTISVMPPAQLLFIAFVLVAGLFVLRRVL